MDVSEYLYIDTLHLMFTDTLRLLFIDDAYVHVHVNIVV